MKLRITILKYHSWYLCQISPQIMLLPIQITFSILVILWPITWPYTAITFFLIAFSNYNVVLILSLKNVLFCVKSTEIEKTFFRVRTDLKSSWIFNKSLKSPWISSRVYPWKSSHFEKENFGNIRISYLTVAGIPNV